MLRCSRVLGLDEQLHAGRAPFATKRRGHSRIATSFCRGRFCRRSASSACAPLAGSRRTDADIALGLLHPLAAQRRGGQFKVNRDLASRPAARCIQPHELGPEHRRQTIGPKGIHPVLSTIEIPAKANPWRGMSVKAGDISFRRLVIL
jgi:hypothetical protein